ncbi:MAG: hypothetical protein AAF363_02000 [Bacteroidota bacterium]
MRRLVILILIVINTYDVAGVTLDSTIKKERSPMEYFELFLSTDPAINDQKLNFATDKWNRFIAQMKDHSFSEAPNDVFIKSLFKNLHRNFLPEYNRQSNFGNLFTEEPTYNCVTATALLSIALETFNIPYAIRETNFHVYVLLPEHDMLLESTNRFGILNGSNDIERRISKYVKENRSSSKNDLIPMFIDKEINLDQFAGLLFFNLAVDYVQKEDWSGAMPYLTYAEQHYYSLRVFYLKFLVSARLPENQNIYVRYKL